MRAERLTASRVARPPRRKKTKDQASCVALTRDDYTDLGVARVGRVQVVTVAAD
ncbi:MAG TPA: hypothetical protein VGQ57_21105 [Polyangiaceae bacterium]|nr:hypothetical protein [Polyangiaceae bacterium]